MYKTHLTSGAWSASDSDTDPWIQAYFGEDTIIYSVTTQGRDQTTEERRVTAYTLAVSDDGYTFNDVTDANGAVIVYDGNTDSTTKVTNVLPDGTTGVLLRLNVYSFYNRASLRWGITGCAGNYFPLPLALICEI